MQTWEFYRKAPHSETPVEYRKQLRNSVDMEKLKRILTTPIGQPKTHPDFPFSNTPQAIREQFEKGHPLSEPPPPPFSTSEFKGWKINFSKFLKNGYRLLDFSRKSESQ